MHVGVGAQLRAGDFAIAQCEDAVAARRTQLQMGSPGVVFHRQKVPSGRGEAALGGVTLNDHARVFRVWHAANDNRPVGVAPQK